MPSLLDMPRELRDQILVLALSSPRSPPQDESQSQNRAVFTDDIKYQSWFGGRDVMYERHAIPNRTETMPTLLVNHQLHYETLDAIAMIRGKHSYELDVMVVNEVCVWPTWLYALEDTDRVDTLHATFRIQGPAGAGYRRRSGFRGGCGGPPLITWCFYSLIERFLRLGIGNRSSGDQDIDRKISIKNLDLNFTNPDTSKYTLAPEGCLLGYIPSCQQSLEWHRRNDGIDYVISADMFLAFIDEMMETLLHMNPSMLYERIGKIRLFLDGNLCKEIDLAKRLRDVRLLDENLRLPPHRRTKVKFDKEWKMEAQKTRIDMGLEVVPFGDEERGE